MTKSMRFYLQIWPFLFAVALLFAARQLEDHYWPVVRDFQIQKIEQHDQDILVSGIMRKVRDCIYLGMTITIDDNGRAVQLPYQTHDRPDQHVHNRPPGAQSWGPWAITVPQSAAGAEIVITAIHSCHPGWTTETRLAEFPLLKGVYQ